MALYLGIDIGTSGCRAAVLDERGAQVATQHVAMAPPQHSGARIEQNSWIWWAAVCTLLEKLAEKVPMRQIEAIAVDGTSGTLLLTDESGHPLCNALMYNDARSAQQAEEIAALAPAESGAHGACSALAKLLWLQQQGVPSGTRHALHQADWIAGQLSDQFGISDENNSLKLGYDIVQRCWPPWVEALGIDHSLLPKVTVPGTPIGTIRKEIARQFGLTAQTTIVSGTTDSIAAFLATGAAEIGDAVTSLGSTLALKVLSDQPIFAPKYGIYSHRLNDRWLVGGASNCGGATLLQFFNKQQLAAMTPQLKPHCPTGLGYYPLPARGERFPINDPNLAPRTTPRPTSDLLFFQGLLEGITAVEKQGYQKLVSFGAPYPKRIFTMGGGANNPAWHEMRQAALGTTVERCHDVITARGTALLALKGSALS